ncbi:ATP-binding protein [Paraburkholderia sp. SIMBA_050]
MLMHQTLSQLKALKLDGMARAFEEQVSLTASTSLSFEERFGIVVDRELAWRDTRRLERLMKAAKLKNPQACIEDIEYRQSRGLDQRVVATLAGCDWIRNAQNIIRSGPTGAGKTWIEVHRKVLDACRCGDLFLARKTQALSFRVERHFAITLKIGSPVARSSNRCSSGYAD